MGDTRTAPKVPSNPLDVLYEACADALSGREVDVYHGESVLGQHAHLIADVIRAADAHPEVLDLWRAMIALKAALDKETSK